MAEYTNMLQVLAAVKKGELLLADVPEKFKSDTVVRIALELQPLEQTTEVVSTLIPPAPVTFNEEIKEIVDELLKEEEVPANVNEVEFAELMNKIEEVDFSKGLLTKIDIDDAFGAVIEEVVQEAVPLTQDAIDMLDKMARDSETPMTAEEAAQEAVVEAPKAKPELTLNAPKHQKNYRR